MANINATKFRVTYVSEIENTTSPNITSALMQAAGRLDLIIDMVRVGNVAYDANAKLPVKVYEARDPDGNKCVVEVIG